ncbi:MAG: glycosyltransferase family 2 protein [Vicinamibacterales bacterium]
MFEALRRYLYGLVARYLAFFIPHGARVVEVAPRHRALADALAGHQVRVFAPAATDVFDAGEIVGDAGLAEADCLILNGCLHFEPDIQAFLERLRAGTRPSTRLLICYYSSLWKPLFSLVRRFGVRTKGPDQNWIAPSDLVNLLRLSGFELVTNQPRVLVPCWIPLVSAFCNRWLAPLPGFRALALANIAVARPTGPAWERPPSVSVVVAARNEAGNIEALVQRLPAMGPDDELIFVEGHSSDATWTTIQDVAARYPARRIRCLQQPGRGKGDAVRAGFAVATKDILMILDADMTVPPEELPKFYRAIASGTGDFINGSRLVYPMEEGSMQFFNILGNKAFALAFSFLLGQRFKDTLCGTKVLSRASYGRLAASRAYFGDFDPFGDFDLLFGAARLGLKMVELPIRYRERTYGTTNIRRWAHGWLLLRMVLFAAPRTRFI